MTAYIRDRRRRLDRRSPDPGAMLIVGFILGTAVFWLLERLGT